MPISCIMYPKKLLLKFIMDAYSIKATDIAREIKMGTYKIPEKMYEKIKYEIEQYHSLGYPSKKVRCIETGQIFENAGIAAKWVAFAREESYCNLDLIKQCCRGKQKTSYGYHWEWVNEEIEKVKERLNKRIE